jgi:hypothetical protein
MAASVGFLVQESGLHFSGYLSKTPEISFESLSGMGALAAWAAVPALGKAQIMTAAGLIEAFSEAKKPVRRHMHAASAARWVGWVGVSGCRAMLCHPALTPSPLSLAALHEGRHAPVRGQGGSRAGLGAEKRAAGDDRRGELLLWLPDPGLGAAAPGLVALSGTRYGIMGRGGSPGGPCSRGTCESHCYSHRLNEMGLFAFLNLPAHIKPRTQRLIDDI